MKYVREHEALPTVEDFHFDAYDDFVAFAKDKEFDYRSSARALFDEMKKVLAEDGLSETMSGELAAMEKSLDMDKETFLRLKKDEIVPFIEEEIAVRYWFQEAGIKVRLRGSAHEARDQLVGYPGFPISISLFSKSSRSQAAAFRSLTR